MLVYQRVYDLVSFFNVPSICDKSGDLKNQTNGTTNRRDLFDPNSGDV